MNRRLWVILAALAAALLLVILILQIPAVNAAAAWRFEKARIYLRNLIDPIGPAPTALPVVPVASTQVPSPIALATTSTLVAASTATPAPLPAQVSLQSPPYEKQTPNNCGPATLSMALHMYGWEGNQTEIAAQIKPVLQDRNVNPEEMAHYVRNFAGWLQIEYRVGGNLQVLKRLLAANYPVMIETTTELDPNDALGPNDDLWAAHYLLLTGYDQASQTFTAQDPYRGADKQVPYSQIEAEWRPFNYLYMLIFLPTEAEEVQDILGTDWDAELNRARGLEAAQSATAADSADAFDWFNLGSNLVYVERYDEAALAYDRAREIGLPLRMFRYQFGPFLAYFHSNRNDDLLLLTDYARGVTEMSEEAWLWYGWGLYRDGEVDKAAAAWNKALSINGAAYVDARLALQTIGQ